MTQAVRLLFSLHHEVSQSMAWRHCPGLRPSLTAGASSAKAGPAARSGRSGLQRGFTLIEVLVAVAVFSVVSLLAFQSLSTSMRVQDRVEQNADRLRQQQLIWTLLMRDFINMARREVRAEDELEPAYQVGSEECSLEVRFTRAGMPIEEANRSGLQRISYCWYNDLLLRRVWPILDRSAEIEPVESVLLQNVSNFYVYSCYEQGCTEGEIDSRSQHGNLPVFVEVFIEFSYDDERLADDQIKQRFWIAGGAYKP